MDRDIAYQKKIKDQKSETPPQGLFGAYWESLDLELSGATIKQIDYKTAQRIIEEYEWLGCMPAVVWHSYGIYFEGVCGGVVVFGPEYSENLGVWDKYGYTGKMILLSRGACTHWSPPNSASKLIAGAIDGLPDEYKVVTATVDPLAGETGTIYQACNFDYVGCMRAQNDSIDNVERFAIKVNNKIIGSRSLRQRIGSQRWEDIVKVYPNAEKCPQVSKSRYFYFRGSVKEKKENRKAIEHLIKEYPKSVEDMVTLAGKVSRVET